MNPEMATALCGCCATGAEPTPVLIDNRPGLSAVVYRVGTFASFREAMLEAIAREPALVDLTTRASDDPAITLFELWAALSDVLTFYQERIANEAFLRTARERDSVLRLARLLDYALRPGIAATTQLVFTLSDGATLTVPTGLRVMSVPGQNERPQIFETIEQIQADARLNAVRIYPVPTALNPFSQGSSSAPMLSHPTPLGPRDTLIFYDATRLEEKMALSIAQTDLGNRLSWSPPVQVADWLGSTSHASRYARTMHFFGYNAPPSYLRFVPSSSTLPYDHWETVNAGDSGYTFDLPDGQATYALDMRYPDLKPGTPLLVDTATGDEPLHLVTVTDVAQAPATQGPLQDTVTQVSVTRYLRSAPAVSSWDIDRLDVFARGGEDTCLHLWWDGSTWSPWESLGGRITSAPAAVSWGPDRIDLFARGTDDALWHLWWDGDTWNGWESLGGVILGAPAVTSWASDRLDVFARGSDLALWHLWWDGTSWNGWEPLGGTLTTDPAAVSYQPDRIDVLAGTGEGTIWHTWWDGVSWASGETVPNKLAGAPALAAGAGGRLDLFGNGTDNALWHTWWDGSSWAAWESLGGVLTSDPGVVARGSGLLDVVSRGQSFGPQWTSWQGAGWSGWAPLGAGIGPIDDLRTAQLYQLEPPEIVFRPYDYAPTLSGGRVAVPLSQLDAVDKGRSVLIYDADGQPFQAVVTGTARLAIGDPNVPDHLAIDLTPDLPALDAATAQLLGNVARASHGQTVRDEILGDGSAAAPFQHFSLQKKPLTYLLSARGGSQDTLQVLINGQEWAEVESLYGQPSAATVYTARQADDGTTTVQFGDGVSGARPPSGRANVHATYRQGAGLEGRVRARQLSVPLDHPPGLKSVDNPAAADGGADPETLDDARSSAPSTVKTFGRAVSLLDFETLATVTGQVARARATWVWRGLEKAVHLTVAGQEGSTFSEDALRLLHDSLDAERDPNHPLLLANVCRIPIVLGATVIVDNAFLRDDVAASVQAALADYFSFERLAFGQTLFLSQIYLALQDVTGVVAADITSLQFKGWQSWTGAQLALRGATAEPLQSHLRIFAARPRGTLIDPAIAGCFASSPIPDVLPAEQATVVDPHDITLVLTGGLS